MSIGRLQYMTLDHTSYDVIATFKFAVTLLLLATLWCKLCTGDIHVSQKRAALL